MERLWRVRSPLAAAALAFVLMAALVGSGWVLVSNLRQKQPLSTETVQKARAGVSSNLEWQPVFRRLEGLEMALVPAGCFRMGSTPQQLEEAVDACDRFYGPGRCEVDFEKSEAPAQWVCFENPFWVGKTEVTNRQYGSSSSTDMVSMYRGPDWPRETVTWDEAAQFCKAHDARLPTEAEWEYAARGPDSLIYPWGDQFDLEKVISGRLAPERVGSVRGGASWVGAFDLSGGVSEWTDSWYAPYREVGTAPAEKYRVVRGGNWFSFSAFFVRGAQREQMLPGAANSTIGFRCARDF